MAALPAGTGLLADPWKMEVTGGWVVPSEEPAALEPVVLEPVAPEPAVLEPVAPESAVQSGSHVCGPPNGRSVSQGYR